MTGEDLAQAAASLCDTPFRLNGRDTNYGIDCIGLLELALEKAGRKITLPTGYTLRLSNPEAWLPDPAACGFAPASLPIQPGDVMLLRLGQAQVHLAVSGFDGAWVHAHAGLRRVVVSPTLPSGEVIGHWRLKPTTDE